MTREEIKKKNEFEKRFKSLLKGIVKKYKIKKKDYMLWTLQNEMISSIFPNAYLKELDFKPVIDIWIEYKPMWADDLLWDILGMQTNKNEPNSLRVIGAFTMISATYVKKSIKLQSDDIEEVRSVLYAEIENFLNSLPILTEQMYISEILNSKTVSDIDKALIYIHQNKINEAKILVKETSDTGRFMIGNKSYQKLVEEYLSTFREIYLWR